MAVVFKSRIPKIMLELPIAVDTAVHAGAVLIEGRAKGRVPVGPGDVHIRDRIHVERVGVAEYEVIAGDDDTWYGHLIEHGTSHSAPHPFMVPSAEESRAETTALVAEAVRRVV